MLLNSLIFFQEPTIPTSTLSLIILCPKCRNVEKLHRWCNA